MMKACPVLQSAAALALTLMSLTSVSHAQEDLSKPVITTETKKDADGKDVLYMYIDGVKVHETDPAQAALSSHRHPGRATRIHRRSLRRHRALRWQ